MTKIQNLAWLEGTGAAAALRSMRASGQLAELLPEVDALYGVPQNPEHHPEVCTGLHTEMCLDMAERLNATPAAKFAVLMHDLGKALTPKNELPKHIDHENRGIEPVTEVCNRLGAPQDMRELALAVCEYHLDAHRSLIMRSQSVLRFTERTGLLKGTQYAEDFLVACEADARGRLGKEENPYPQGKFLRRVLNALDFLP
ncbi:HD domain-containing protein, partial [Nostoc sp. CHAB 5834]|nr:HD domain-containing protein [Nostoc sp. CHAB 5834]